MSPDQAPTTDPARLVSAAQLRDLVGTVLGQSAWLEVQQARVDRFAHATGDDQWIHVDRDRAAKGPYGATIAHGYLTMSLIPFLARQVYRFELSGAVINYGVDRVRFPSPVVVGSRLRDTVSVEKVSEPRLGHLLVSFGHRIDVEGRDVPACVASTLTLVAL